jgi:hypothetical protein
MSLVAACRRLRHALTPSTDAFTGKSHDLQPQSSKLAPTWWTH